MTQAAERCLRVLVLTNHFREFAGSEIVALEVALWFAARGDVVTLAANVASAPILTHAAGVHVTTDIAGLNLSAFDLIWCQHDMLALAPLSAWEAAATDDAIPHVAYVSLSPYEPYEHLNGSMARALSADVYANSPETAAAIAAANHGLIQHEHVRVFFNAAPKAFWNTPHAAASTPHLRSILLVSNHPPAELDACASLLEQRDVEVRRIGLGREFSLLTPAHLQACDAVVTIGKTVVYAIAQRKPVFIYDNHGGGGWLTRDNFQINRDHNFSGRPARRRLSAEQLATEIIAGHVNAAAEMDKLSEAQDLAPFRLDAHLAPLRQRALERNLTWPRRFMRRWRLASRLRDARFRAHMEAARSKTEVMRQLRRQIDTSSV